MSRIAAVQRDCSLPADDIPVTTGGGFASKFQLGTGIALQSLRKGRAVRIVGHFARYSEIDYCRQLLGSEHFEKLGSFECFFLPARPCENATNGFSPAPAAVATSSAEALAALKSATKEELGEAYQALEAFLFRPRDATIAEFRLRQAQVAYDQWSTDPLVGIHIRRGDKVVDSYNRYYTTQEYAEALVNWAASSPLCSGRARATFVVYVASDSGVVKPQLHALLGTASVENCGFRVIGADASVSQTASDSHRFDHWGEIQGMAGKVDHLKGDEAKSASFDILFDIFMLSRADLLIGSLTSQIGRIAAGLRIAVGYQMERYHPPIAMDYPNLASVAGMGEGSGIPSPSFERWTPVPATKLSLSGPAFPESLELENIVCLMQADAGRREEVVDLSQGHGDLPERLLEAAAQAAVALRGGAAIRLVGHLGRYSELPDCEGILGKDNYTKRGGFTCHFLHERECLAAPSVRERFRDSAALDAALQSAVKGQAGEAALRRAALAFLTRPTQRTIADFLKRYFVARTSEESRSADDPMLLLGVQIVGESTAPLFDKPAPRADAYSEVLKKWSAQAVGASAEPQTCRVLVASDGNEALVEMRQLLDGKTSGRCKFSVVGLFEYWAHHHFRGGYNGSLSGGDGMWATRDIIFDLHMLSKSDVLLGVRGSPMARAAAQLRRALYPSRAARHAAIAMDMPAPEAMPDSDEGWVSPPT